MDETLPASLPALDEAPVATGRISTWPERARRAAPWCALALLATAAWVWWRHARTAENGAIAYRTAVVQAGEIIQTVSASGPLSAVSTVSVGSQVSGNISKLYVDFNDPVKVEMTCNS